MQRDHDRPTLGSLAHCFWCTALHASPHPLSVCAACTAAFRGEQLPMRSLDMARCYPLATETIDEVVSRRSAGNYALGYLDGATFTVFYVGRSDSDVRGRLQEWVGRASCYERYAGVQKAAWGTRTGRRSTQTVPTLRPVVCAVDSAYTCFAYSYASSAESAFAKEWRNFDDFGGCGALDNDVPPAPHPLAIERDHAHPA